MKILEVNGVSKKYGDHEVLRDIDIELDSPGIFGLVGPNGSGKSTLMNVIANLIQKNSGIIEICEILNTNPDIYSKFSYMIDNTVLYPYLTGMDHLKFISDMNDLKKTAIREYSELLGISSFLNKKVGEYSLGMKQQLLFTMTVMTDRDFMMLDEPFNGLDPTTIIKVRSILKDLAKSGKTILLSSHNLSEIDQMTSDILFLKDGVILREDISKVQKTRYSIKTDGVIESSVLNPEIYSINEDRIEFDTESINVIDAIDEIREHYRIVDIKKEVIGSEERYRELFDI